MRSEPSPNAWSWKVVAIIPVSRFLSSQDIKRARDVVEQGLDTLEAEIQAVAMSIIDGLEDALEQWWDPAAQVNLLAGDIRELEPYVVEDTAVPDSAENIVALLFESPHTMEVCRRQPLSGDAGLAVTRTLGTTLQIPNAALNCPFGEVLARYANLEVGVLRRILRYERVSTADAAGGIPAGREATVWTAVAPFQDPS